MCSKDIKCKIWSYKENSITTYIFPQLLISVSNNNISNPTIIDLCRKNKLVYEKLNASTRTLKTIIFPTFNNSLIQGVFWKYCPAGSYLFKALIETLEQGVKYV